MFGYKITRGKVNIWAKVAVLTVTKTTATMDQSDRYATRVNNAKILKRTHYNRYTLSHWILAILRLNKL